MRKSTRIVAGVGCLLVALVGLYPPLEVVFKNDGKIFAVRPVGRAFLFANDPRGWSDKWKEWNPDRTRRFVFERMVTEWVVIAAGTAGVILLLGLRNRSESAAPRQAEGVAVIASAVRESRPTQDPATVRDKRSTLREQWSGLSSSQVTTLVVLVVLIVLAAVGIAIPIAHLLR